MRQQEIEEIKNPPFDTVGFIMAWEGCETTAGEEVAGFQHLIDNGAVWHLQGCYGRAARQLIASGFCVDTHNVLGKAG